MSRIPDIKEIQKAAERLSGIAHNTPVMTNCTIDKVCNCKILFKCENFQKVGAFKFRGAYNAVASLPKNKLSKGVVTHSSGNHAAALTLAAKLNNIKAYIVMPKTAPELKKNAVKSYGAEITFCEPTLKSREETAQKVIDRTGAQFIHPFNNYSIIAGQATAAMELINDCGKLDYILAPVGGGGLLSGTSLSAKYLSPKTKVIGCEPEGADDAYRSFRDGKIYPSENPSTICDGLLTSLGEKTFKVISKYVDEIITVDDESIIGAMRMVWERMKIIIEPSSAVPLAVVMNNEEKFAGKQLGIIISGGNVDLSKLPWS